MPPAPERVSFPADPDSVLATPLPVMVSDCAVPTTRSNSAQGVSVAERVGCGSKRKINVDTIRTATDGLTKIEHLVTAVPTVERVVTAHAGEQVVARSAAERVSEIGAADALGISEGISCPEGIRDRAGAGRRESHGDAVGREAERIAVEERIETVDDVIEARPTIENIGAAARAQKIVEITGGEIVCLIGPQNSLDAIEGIRIAVGIGRSSGFKVDRNSTCTAVSGIVDDVQGSGARTDIESVVARPAGHHIAVGSGAGIERVGSCETGQKIGPGTAIQGIALRQRCAQRIREVLPEGGEGYREAAHGCQQGAVIRRQQPEFGNRT